MSILDLRNAKELYFGSTAAKSLYYGNELIWTTPTANITQLIYHLSAGTGTTATPTNNAGTFDFVNGLSWRANPSGLTFNGTNNYMTMPRASDYCSTNMLMGVVVRFSTVAGVRQLISISDNTDKIFQFRCFDGALQHVNFIGGTGSSQGVAGALTANEWVLATLFIGPNYAVIRKDGIELARITFASRNTTMSNERRIMVGARGGPSLAGVDFFSGDMAALAITNNATEAMIPDFEAQLRSIATTKGITLPNALPPIQLVNQPTANPTTAIVGETINLSDGSWNNAIPTVTLTQGGVNRTSEINDGVWSPTTSGPFTWTVRAATNAGSLTANIINGVIEPAPIPLTPPLYYMYAGHEDATQAVGQEVLTLTARGTGALNFVHVGGTTLQSPIKEADAIRFSAARYLTSNNVTLSTGDGFILAAEFTAKQTTGTQQVLILSSGAGIFGGIRGAAASAQVYVGPNINGTAQNINIEPLAIDKRYKVVAEFDRTANTVRYWNSASNTIATQAVNFTNAITPNRINICQSSNVSLHRVGIYNRPSGTEWEYKLEDVLEQFGIDYENGSASPLTAIRLYPGDGQSLELGPNIGGTFAPSGPRWREVFNSSKVRMLSGHVRKDAVNVTHVAAPLLQGYNTSVSATGDATAYAASSIPPGLSLIHI